MVHDAPRAASSIRIFCAAEYVQVGLRAQDGTVAKEE
jgi:hypothetical protein